MGEHSVQAVGDFTSVFSHPLVLGGLAIAMTGFKLEGEILDTTQLIENSKVVPLLNGSSITITNNNKSGTIKYNCCKHSGSLERGDITEIAGALLSVADSQGGTIRISFGLNGQTYAITFIAVTVKTCPPLKVSGNDVPDYGIEFNYADWVKS
jgi:hypothetical protein